LAQVLNVQVDEPPAPVDAEPQIDRAEELRQKWRVEVGQLWQLDEHRIICGDCTDAAVVARVMDNERAELMLADPEYDASMDWLSADEFQKIDHWLVMASDRQHAAALRTHGARFNQFFVVFFRQFSWNLNVYIPILQHVCVAHYRSDTAKNYHLNGLHSVIECSSKFDRTSEHLHAKHTEIVEPLIAGFSRSNALVLDLFSGSGTTLIACENLKRRCRAVEIEPKYVAVALERWATATGRTPERIDDGG
jgi:DNA modification methylase